MTHASQPLVALEPAPFSAPVSSPLRETWVHALEETGTTLAHAPSLSCLK